VEVEPALSEHGLAVNEHAAGARIRELAATIETPAVVCSHRPVLHHLTAALGITDPIPLNPGELLAVHLADGVPVAMERQTGAPDPAPH
jgi:hypothetical protein